MRPIKYQISDVRTIVSVEPQINVVCSSFKCLHDYSLIDEAGVTLGKDTQCTKDLHCMIDGDKTMTSVIGGCLVERPLVLIVSSGKCTAAVFGGPAQCKL